jgi:hypothetical protein
MELEPGLVETIRKDGQNVLQQHEVERAVKARRDLRIALDVEQQRKQCGQTLHKHHTKYSHVRKRTPRRKNTTSSTYRLGDISLRMLERPNDRIHHELLELLRQRKERLETVLVHSLEQLEKVHSVFREIFEILRDHLERALEDRVQNARHKRRDRLLQTVDDGRQEA